MKFLSVVLFSAGWFTGSCIFQAFQDVPNYWNEFGNAIEVFIAILCYNLLNRSKFS